MGPRVRAGRAGRAPGLHSAHPSTLQFPSLQNQNQMQALDKRYPCTLGAGLTGGRGALGKQRLLPGQSGHQPLAFLPTIWYLAQVSKHIHGPTPEGQVAGARQPVELGKGAEGLLLGPLAEPPPQRLPSLLLAARRWQGMPQAEVALVCQVGGGPGGPDPDQEEAGAPGL